MCGNYGYIGSEDSIQKCLEGLRSLEYRGYDSAGIAGFDGKKLFLCKAKGKIASLEKRLPKAKLKLNVAIGHTRWATCGEVNRTNAHPHTDSKLTLALVHNGIIENFSSLKDKMKLNGIEFVSETDTEVLAQLISSYYTDDIVAAISKGLKDVRGSFSVSLIHKDYPNKIFCFSRECPLCIGYSDDQSEIIIASDPNAFLGQDLNIVFLGDNEIASIEKEKVLFYDQHINAIIKNSQKITGSHLKPTKEGFEHFMLKEIYDQPKTLRMALEEHLNGESVLFKNLQLTEDELKNVDQLYILGCGTSYHAGYIGAYLFEEILGIPTQTEIGSEFRYRKPLLTKNSLVLALSQSGETADTIAAVKLVKEKGAKVIGLCNQKNSRLSRLADHSFYIHAGPEISVCSTKSFTSHLLILTLFALFMAKIRGIKVDANFLTEVKKLPQKVEQILAKADKIQALAKKYAHYPHFAFIGRSYMYPSAMEAALKLKEISYLNASAYASGELKHGPIALLDKNFPIVALCHNKATLEKIRSNILEAKARKSPILAFGFKQQNIDFCDDYFTLPDAPDPLAPILSAVALQLFAYFIAYEKNTEIDQPKNLAKSVTVE